MLMIPTLASARMVPRASSSDTMQLNCTTGFPVLDCLRVYGTSCSAAGVVQNANSTDMPTNGDCTAKHCTCEMTPPPFCFTETGTRGSGVVCGPYAYDVSTLFDGTGSSSTGNAAAATPTDSMPTVLSGSECATVTMTVTVTQHHRANNGTWPYALTGWFPRHRNETATHHHHKSGITETESVSTVSFFPLTVAPRTTIASIPLISLTGNPEPQPPASSLSGQPSFLPPTFSAAGTPVGASAPSSSAPYN